MHTRLRRLLLSLGCSVTAAAIMTPAGAEGPREPGPSFRTSHTCLSCHNGLLTPTGEDVSIGSAWRSGMMANASRDPYWLAGVRRELLDHPDAAAAIEDECSICHMPMNTVSQRASGAQGRVFEHVSRWPGGTPAARLAQDGTSCAVCHQIGPERLGQRDSFTGGFVVHAGAGPDGFRILGPFDVDSGRIRVMQSASGFRPTAASHVQQSELCATCHTLFTHAIGPGASAGELPEQVPYLEWRHSAYGTAQSCQDCHMSVVGTPTPVSAVVGEPRDHFSRHAFHGGNFLVPRLLTLHRAELGTEATPQELDTGIRRTLDHLRTHAATVSISQLEVRDGTLFASVHLESLAGHKLPTAYPSRRAWLHLTVRDRAGKMLFESGRLDPSGRIDGNDNDADGGQYEPHHREIRSANEVQIYEAVMGDARGSVTTGLLTAVRFLKDNRVLPRGFHKAGAPADVAVLGTAEEDPDFVGGSDEVRYAVELGAARGPFSVTAELLYQPIGWRWAHNLSAYDAAETERFVRYFDELKGATATVLARTDATQ